MGVGDVCECVRIKKPITAKGMAIKNKLRDLKSTSSELNAKLVRSLQNIPNKFHKPQMNIIIKSGIIPNENLFRLKPGSVAGCLESNVQLVFTNKLHIYLTFTNVHW